MSQDNIARTNQLIQAQTNTQFGLSQTPDTLSPNASAQTPTAGTMWVAIQMLSDTTFTEVKEIVGGTSTAVSALATTLSEGIIVYGQFTSVKFPTTGLVRCYYIAPV